MVRSREAHQFAGRLLRIAPARAERLSARASFAAIGTTSLLLWLATIAVFQLLTR